MFASYIRLFYFQCTNSFSSTEAQAEYLTTKALEMTFALQRIAQFYFAEAELGSPYISILLEIDNQFIDGCEDLIKILRALKNQLQYNICFCNTLDCC